MPLNPLPDATRTALATALATRGQLAVAVAIGTDPATLRRARDGVPVRATTASVIASYITKLPQVAAP